MTYHLRDRELRDLAARVQAGNTKLAAHRLGQNPDVLKRSLTRMLRRCGCASLDQAVWVHRHELEAFLRTPTPRPPGQGCLFDDAA